jgi:hypothetical protein
VSCWGRSAEKEENEKGNIFYIRNTFDQEWWLTPIIPAPRRLRQEASLGYIERPCLKIKTCLQKFTCIKIWP